MVNVIVFEVSISKALHMYVYREMVGQLEEERIIHGTAMIAGIRLCNT